MERRIGIEQVTSNITETLASVGYKKFGHDYLDDNLRLEFIKKVRELQYPRFHLEMEISHNLSLVNCDFHMDIKQHRKSVESMVLPEYIEERSNLISLFEDHKANNFYRLLHRSLTEKSLFGLSIVVNDYRETKGTTISHNHIQNLKARKPKGAAKEASIRLKHRKVEPIYLDEINW